MRLRVRGINLIMYILRMLEDTFTFDAANIFVFVLVSKATINHINRTSIMNMYF